MYRVCILISKDLYQKLMNTNKLCGSLYQELILLFNNSMIRIEVYRGVHVTQIFG